ncbi:Hypothetical predicted protein [Podarcis lilfordi]|uniref:Uncharacterized protein n=1 Tax=Podarcis lilfordi TaxID=74358 RepID=A0AA35KTG4_9SAUR|nr:Hypothetical predicted protein [Podarcis lilfordi]
MPPGTALSFLVCWRSRILALLVQAMTPQPKHDPQRTYSLMQNGSQVLQVPQSLHTAGTAVLGIIPSLLLLFLEFAEQLPDFLLTFTVELGFTFCIPDIHTC